MSIIDTNAASPAQCQGQTTFTFPGSLSLYHASPAAYLSANPSANKLVVGAVIIHDRRALLVQRAAHDGFALKWECPGGCVDLTDPTILHALCREVAEETGLVVSRVAGVLDQVEFDGREVGWRWRKITFLAEIDRNGQGVDGVVPTVRLDPGEHCDAVWADEQEVMAGKCQGRVIEFAYENQRGLVLGALRAASV
ncbi:hypothetical protein MFIFM68171_05577 [Madurella fahalii]|uniref:Nudix hydrolase domain-containing protein n=1 Tax=Madurella fahalii TaxID=1157608 RepID=A0ABQ0GC73_9PEZI